MRNYRLGSALVLVVLAGCSTLSGPADEPSITAPVPTTAAPFTAAPVTTTVPPTTVPPTTVPTGPVAVGGEPFLVDIPGKLIDYIPDVAANLNIDVPGQYYEILPKFYVFIPAQASTTNGNLQPPDPADQPIIEAYVRAVAETWKMYTIDPIPAEGSPEMKAAYTQNGYSGYSKILADAAAAQIHTEVHGNMIVPRVDAGTRTETSALVLDCGWLNQSDINPAGEVVEDWNRIDGGSADIVKGDGAWMTDRFESDSQGCS